jgi:hypothetical protein
VQGTTKLQEFNQHCPKASSQQEWQSAGVDCEGVTSKGRHNNQINVLFNRLLAAHTSA